MHLRKLLIITTGHTSHRCKNMDLTEIKGIGDKTKEKLVEKGIETAEQLATVRPEELKEILGISLLAAKEIIIDAKNKTLDAVFKTMTLEEVKDYKNTVVKRISTGSMAIDNFLKGGIPTESIVMFSGEYSSGKTQMCMQLAVNCIKMGRKVAWIETEAGTFSPDRIEQIAKLRRVPIDMEKDFPIIILAKNVGTPHMLFLAYEMVDKICTKNNIDLGLLVIDSFASPFRSTYSGREMLPERAKEESRHFGKLNMIASKYNCAIVLTNQAIGIPDAGQQLGVMMKTGAKHDIYGGNVIKHSATYHFILSKGKSEEWVCFCADSPELPRQSIPFRITEMGISDVVAR